jgi:hypothetical protein
VRTGDPERRGDQGRACDDESERDSPSGDRHRPGPDLVTEDQDAADDRDEVGSHRGEAPRLRAPPASPPRTTWTKEPGGALRSGCRTRTGGAEAAPRCLSRKETLVASAQARASASPKVTALGIFSDGRHACRLECRLGDQDPEQIAHLKLLGQGMAQR